MNLKDFPKLSEVNKAIEKIKANGFPRYTNGNDARKFVKEIEQILTNEFGILFNPVKPLKHKEFSLKIFRAREANLNTDFNLIREHSYPPIDLTRMGRCNFPKYPVFYGSDNAMTALIEVARNTSNPNKKYFISKWEILSPEETLIFQTFLQTELPEENLYKIFQKEIKEKINEPFEKSFNEKLDPVREKGLIKYLSYLDSSFIRDNDYSLSASLAYRTLYAEHNYRTDILMYPSVQTKFQGVNLAIQPNFVENYLKLNRIYEVSLENYNSDQGSVSISFHKYGIVEKNVVMWKNIAPDDDFYNEMVKKDFGNIISSKFKKKNNLPQQKI